MLKKIIYLIGILLGILIVSAFIAPLIAQFVDYKFYRILSRCIMVQVLLVSVIFYLRADKTNLKNLITSYGLKWHKGRSMRAIVKGFSVSFFIMVLLMVIEVFLGARVIVVNIKNTFVIQVIEYIFAAFIIAFIEEYFFRGMIFTKLSRWSVGGAFIITNVFYAIVHFFQAKQVMVSEVPTVFDSMKVIGGFLEPLMNPLAILPGFVGLFIFGAILTYAFSKTGSLYWSIGVHAGAVFFLKADGFLLNINEKMPQIIYGDKNIYTGILGWLSLGIMWGILILILPKSAPRQS